VYNSSGLAYYRHSDWLGSSRLTSSVTTPTKWLYSGAYAPFGESYTEATNTGGVIDHSFTGQNEDTVQGLDDFMFREYSSAQQGRWIRPDPAGMASVSLAIPQSWNQYAYVVNNPLAFIDALGLDCTVNPGGGSLTCTGTTVDVFGTFDSVALASIGGSDTNQAGKLRKAPERGRGGESFAHYLFTHFTTGIRQPGQTFGNCMSANASTYSLGGAMQSIGNSVLGANSTFLTTNPVANVLTGNMVNTFFFGSTTEAAGTMAINSPGIVANGMGQALTYGRPQADLIGMNLAGRAGDAIPSALGQGERFGAVAMRQGFEDAGQLLGLGMTFTERIIVDTTFTGAEALNCLGPG